MASARYSCSSTMIRARWWGKVMGPMEIPTAPKTKGPSLEWNQLI